METVWVVRGWDDDAIIFEDKAEAKAYFMELLSEAVLSSRWTSIMSEIDDCEDCCIVTANYCVDVKTDNWQVYELSIQTIDFKRKGKD